jgi:translation elongation factor EF-Ts
MRKHLLKSQNLLLCFGKSNKFYLSTYVAPLNLVKQLREETSSPITECKKALELHNGDLTKAKEYLKEKGLSQAQKKLSRAAKEGVIGVFHNESTRVTAMAEVLILNENGSE